MVYEARYDTAGRRWVVVDRDRGQVTLPPCASADVAADLAEVLNLGAELRTKREQQSRCGQ